MKRMIIILMITILVMIAGYKVYSVHLVQEFQKYCIDDCEVTHVSKAELDNVKQSRNELAITNIINYQDHISSTKQRLSNYELDDELLDRLGKAKVTSEYNSDLDYSIDELIELEEEYKQVSDELDQIEFEFNQSTYQTEIAGYQKEIKRYKEKLEQTSLSDDEQEQYETLNSELNSIDYDQALSYDLDELHAYAKEYKGLANQYNYLVS